MYEQKAPSTPFGNPEDPLNPLALAIAAGASFVARGASFNTKALTELITQAIEHKGFSYIDAMSPCTTFNNTQDSWKEAVTDVAPDHDVTDRTQAFDLALKGGFAQAHGQRNHEQAGGGQNPQRTLPPGHGEQPSFDGHHHELPQRSGRPAHPHGPGAFFGRHIAPDHPVRDKAAPGSAPK
mgnify:CR=1 FL=1